MNAPPCDILSVAPRIVIKYNSRLIIMSEDAVIEVLSNSGINTERVHSPIAEFTDEPPCDDHKSDDSADKPKSGIEEVTSMLKDMIEQALHDETEATRKLLPISDQMVGIVFAVMQMGNMGVISRSKAAEMISLFYHFDTSGFLHHTKFPELVMHDKCMKYAKKMEDGIVAYNRRTTKFKLNEGIEDLARPHSEDEAELIDLNNTV